MLRPWYCLVLQSTGCINPCRTVLRPENYIARALNCRVFESSVLRPFF
jgi:hypothetical protein